MVPNARQKVRIAGQSGSFFVLAVDRDQGRAYLTQLEGPKAPDWFSFEEILPIEDAANLPKDINPEHPS